MYIYNLKYCLVDNMCASISQLQKPLESLKQAIDNEDISTLRSLLGQIRNPRDLNRGIDSESNTLLHLAAQKNFLEGVRLLIGSGAHPSVCNHAFKTPIELATDSAVIEELARVRDQAIRLWENREGLPGKVLHKYQQIWSAPIGSDIMKGATDALDRLKSAPRPIVSPEALLAARKNTSNTMKSELYGQQAAANWAEADQLVTELATQKDPIQLIKMTQTIHRIIARDLPIAHPGEFRKLGNNVDRSNGQPYIFGDDVQKEMEVFEEWLQASLNLCDQGLYNPLVLAALTFQRFLAIHPFGDGNGRVGRLLVDYILQRYHLPVAVITSDVELTEVPPGNAISCMIDFVTGVWTDSAPKRRKISSNQ